MNNNREKVVNYLKLRHFIGIIGLATPIVLPITTFLLSDQNPFQISISHYYFSVAHIGFVGALCLLSGFLLSYRGTERIENRVSNIAGVFALGVAMFPTCWDGFETKQEFILNNYKDYFDLIHYLSASGLFICFAIFCMYVFQNADDGNDNYRYDIFKIRRNKFYKGCGIIIVISIAIIASIWFLGKFNIIDIKTEFKEFCIVKYSTFILETTSLVPFGASWLVKGSLFWNRSSFLIWRKLGEYFRGKN
jgi:hypothetical protein